MLLFVALALKFIVMVEEVQSVEQEIGKVV